MKHLLVLWLAMCMLACPAIAQDEPPKEEAKPVTEATPPAEEKPAEEKPAEEKPAEEKPAEEKPAEEKPAEQPPAVDTPAATEKDGLKVTTVVEGLDNPCGIAIQPETGVIFVADSGASRIVKIVDGKAEPVITDFPVDVYGKGPSYNIGPLGLLFLDQNTLVVGGGGLPDGEELLRVYDLKEKELPIKADAMKASYSLAATDEVKGEGNFYALAKIGDAIYVTCNGDDTKGWVSKATIADGSVTQYERYLATKEAVEVDAPVGVVASPRNELVVGQMGEINVANDSLLTFYDPGSKKTLLNLKTNLHDITSLAYSPRGQLYALDFAWMDLSQGGLFQILKGDAEACKVQKILAIDKPTAMVFGADGALYVTAIGAEKKGSVMMIEPGL